VSAAAQTVRASPHRSGAKGHSLERTVPQHPKKSEKMERSSVARVLCLNSYILLINDFDAECENPISLRGPSFLFLREKVYLTYRLQLLSPAEPNPKRRPAALPGQEFACEKRMINISAKKTRSRIVLKKSIYVAGRGSR